jgi:hypothetical protein
MGKLKKAKVVGSHPVNWSVVGAENGFVQVTRHRVSIDIFSAALPRNLITVTLVLTCALYMHVFKPMYLSTVQRIWEGLCLNLADFFQI